MQLDFNFPAREEHYAKQTNNKIAEIVGIVQFSDFLANTMQNYDNELFCKNCNRLKLRSQQLLDELGIGAKG